MTLAKKMMARKSITRPPRANKSAARKKQLPASEKTLLAPETVSSKKDDIIQTRTIAHDLSNSLEAILQASYLLSQAKLDPNSKRWVQLIDSASQEAARLNRELRKHLRNICED
jgi:signal transduction histidine kinase